MQELHEGIKHFQNIKAEEKARATEKALAKLEQERKDIALALAITQVKYNNPSLTDNQAKNVARRICKF